MPWAESRKTASAAKAPTAARDTCPLREFIDYKTSMTTYYRPLQGLLFYWDLGFSPPVRTPALQLNHATIKLKIMSKLNHVKIKLKHAQPPRKIRVRTGEYMVVMFVSNEVSKEVHARHLRWSPCAM